jgi:hypothetical protein
VTAASLTEEGRSGVLGPRGHTGRLGGTPGVASEESA